MSEVSEDLEFRRKDVVLRIECILATVHASTGMPQWWRDALNDAIDEIARLRREKEALVEALELITQPLGPLDNMEMAEAWIEDARSAATSALRSATKTEENPRGKVVRKEIMATDVADPEWVKIYMPGSIDPIMGRVGTLFEETEEILQGRAEKRNIIRVVDGKDFVVWQDCYAVHRSDTETKDGQS